MYYSDEKKLDFPKHALYGQTNTLQFRNEAAQASIKDICKSLQSDKGACVARKEDSKTDTVNTRV